MSVLYTRDSVYRPSGAGTYRDDPSNRVKAGDSWLKPANTKENPQDRYAEDMYAEDRIEPER